MTRDRWTPLAEGDTRWWQLHLELQAWWHGMPMAGPPFLSLSQLLEITLLCSRIRQRRWQAAFDEAMRRKEKGRESAAPA